MRGTPEVEQSTAEGREERRHRSAEFNAVSRMKIKNTQNIMMAAANTTIKMSYIVEQKGDVEK